jgi:cytochrome c-type biogenesis protein CcmH/NrfG
MAEAHSNLSDVLREAGHFNEAVGACQEAIRLAPAMAAPYNNLGNVLRDQQKLPDALDAYRKALAIRPDFHEAWLNFGHALREQGELNQAEAAYSKAVQLRLDWAEAHKQLANVMEDLGQQQRSIAECREAIRLRPDYAQAHTLLASNLLRQGDFEEGWAEYEWRLKLKERALPRGPLSQPRWDGGDYRGKTVFLLAEQGFGDLIQFVRYVPLVAQRGGRVIVECPAELAGVVRSVAGISQVVPPGAPAEFDLYCPLLSLPFVFKTGLDSIPASVPYLSADRARIDPWISRLIPDEAMLRVGLAWAGSKAFKGDRTRSMSLDQLAPLGNVDGVKFYSLQKGAPAQEAKNPPEGLELVDLGSELKDFSDTAAVMSLMDLIITTDTSIPHLAGALGRPVWVMLQFAPDWRWLAHRQDSPWYPTMRLFRQAKRGDWAGVVERVREALEAQARDAT